jgi:hypothetical protein
MHYSFMRSEPSHSGIIRHFARYLAKARHDFFYRLTDEWLRQNSDRFAHQSIALSQSKCKSHARRPPSVFIWVRDIAYTGEVCMASLPAPSGNEKRASIAWID